MCCKQKEEAYSAQIFRECANIGACMDVKAHRGMIYAIQKANGEHLGRLCVLNAELELLALYEGIGDARQIEMVGDLAFITARGDGLWIFDVGEIQPKLKCHYHTVEFATGVALCGNLAFISCRQYGVEILDISDPLAPLHIGLIRVGEVQSATLDHGVLYCGVWARMKVVIVDVNDPTHPRVLSEVPLQGRGDGVFVKDGILYAATGQHARGIVNSVDRNDPAFGRGNGLECFDVSDPASPKKLKGILFEKGHCLTVDMWEPAIYGDTLVVNNSILGVYGLDPDSLQIRFHLVPPEQYEINAVTGVTVLGGDLFAASCGDLFAARGLGLGEGRSNPEDIRFPTASPVFSYEGSGAEPEIVYKGNFPVIAIHQSGELLALACAEGGVHLLDQSSLEPRLVIPTVDHARDVKLFGNLLYIAEGLAGVEIFRIDQDSATKIGGFAENKAINQLSLSQSGRYLMCGVSAYELRMYDVLDPTDVKELYSYETKTGIFYGNNFAANTRDDGTMIAFGHNVGLLTTNPDGGLFRFVRTKYTKKIGTCRYTEEGVECDGEKIFYTVFHGYVFVSDRHESPASLNELPCYPVEEGFTGLLTLGRHMLIASFRPKGIVWAVDIADPQMPRVLAKLEMNASPAKAIFVGDRILIPAGRAGLLLMRVG